MPEDQTPDQTPADDFDIDDWMDGASTETQTVRIYRNLGMLGEYERLEQQFRQIQAELGGLDDEDDNPDRALGEETPASRLETLAPKMRQVYDDLQADALWATVRGLSIDELEAARRRIASVKDKGQALALEILANGTTFATDDGRAFTLDTDRLKKFRNAVGEKQFNALTGAAFNVNDLDNTGHVVMPDFSPGASAYLETGQP